MRDHATYPSTFLTHLYLTVAEEGRMILSGADVVIVDGDAVVPKERHQIVLHVVAALPGDQVFGHLPHDCDEGLLLALTGFFTDMALSW